MAKQKIWKMQLGYLKFNQIDTTKYRIIRSFMKETIYQLATEGYIVQRRNSDIEEILTKARQLREIDNNKQ